MLLFRQLYRSLFHSKNTHYRLTGKRIKVLILFFVLFLYGMTVAWIGFFLDYLFFPFFRRQKVIKPVFIIGNFRSGSTLLHRLMARDFENFRAFKTWEIYLAPSIAQRKFFRTILHIDGLFGNPIRKFFQRFEEKTFNPIRLHKIGLRQPEEEEGIFLYIWNSFFVRYIFPVKEEFAQFDYFDRLIHASRRKRIMRFYKKCVMRLLYTHGGKGSLLSKNPCFSPKVKSLFETFPDAKFIYLVREPIKTSMSKISWFSVCFNFFNSCLEKYPYKEETIELMKLWYSYPVEILKTIPKRNYTIVWYDEFVKDPEKTIRKIYRQFDFKPSKRFLKILQADCRVAKNFKSSLEVTAEEIGIPHPELKKRFSEVKKYWTNNQFDKKPDSR